ncbi:Ceramide synthase 1 [Halotydeus destructor]|nr:Ceramide synthase 1 [Halotydeus destructor]
MAVPTNIYIIYMAQISFYINSLYTAVLVDQWRRDSPVLIVHHVITVILLVFTLSLRCHRSGLMALFLHDVCDILLEATKTLLYFKTQAGQPVKVCQTMADIGFALFSVTWFVNRLYLFPLRNIYISWSYPSDNHLDIPFLFALTCLLYLLLAMNVYWFSFILNLLYKVVTGQVLEDSREYEEPEAEMDLKKSDIQVEISQNGGPGNSIDEEISSESVLRRRRDILAPESDSKGRSN